jgi:hypothetical protein
VPGIIKITALVAFPSNEYQVSECSLSKIKLFILYLAFEL